MTPNPVSVAVGRIHTASNAISVNRDTGAFQTVSSATVMGTQTLATQRLEAALSAETIQPEVLATGEPSSV